MLLQGTPSMNRPAMLLHNRHPKRARLFLIAACLTLSLLGYRSLLCSPSTDFLLHEVIEPEETPSKGKLGAWEPLVSPPEVEDMLDGSSSSDRQTPTCANKLDTKYLDTFRKHRTEHCSSKSRSTLTCFHDSTIAQARDSLCVAKDMVLHERTGHFTLDCDISHGPKKESQDNIVVEKMLRRFAFELRRKSSTQRPAPLRDDESYTRQTNYTILIKREVNASFWNSLMEIFSMMLSVDVLRTSRDSRLGEGPFFRAPADMPRTQVIVVDDLPEGPLYDLWSFFARSRPIRLKDILRNQTKFEELSSAHTAIVPLPGHSNALAMIEQDAPNCHGSNLARTFADRVLQHYGMLRPAGGNNVSELARVTIIDRMGTRMIRNIDLLLRALHAAFPQVVAEPVDFAKIPMADQLQIVQSTDILIGASGAGLSHTLFMREGEGAVIEIQPPRQSESTRNARYETLAAMMGQKFIRIECEVHSREEVKEAHEGDESSTGELERLKQGESHVADLVVSEGELVSAVGRAIEALIAG